MKQETVLVIFTNGRIGELCTVIRVPAASTQLQATQGGVRQASVAPPPLSSPAATTSTAPTVTAAPASGTLIVGEALALQVAPIAVLRVLLEVTVRRTRMVASFVARVALLVALGSLLIGRIVGVGARRMLPFVALRRLLNCGFVDVVPGTIVALLPA